LGTLRYALVMAAAVISHPDRDAEIAALTAALASAKAELAARDLLIETLRVQIARLRRMSFGASSEKLSRQIEQLELALEELEAETAPVAQTEAVSPKPERPTPVRSLPEHLPREDVVAQPSSGTCTCPDCGGALRKLAPNSSMSSRSSGAWCAPSGPSIAAGPARRLSRHLRR
jgi:hypothetical protein